jgi:phage N-6-adenine-methyltransferase
LPAPKPPRRRTISPVKVETKDGVQAMPFAKKKGRQDWRTPQWLFDGLDSIFKFDCDAAADETNHLLPVWWDDAFNEDWTGRRLWINPPFSKAKGVMYDDKTAMFLAWAKKAELAVVIFPIESCIASYFHKSPPKWLFIPNGRISFWHPDEPKKSKINFGCVLAFYGKVSVKQMKQVQKVVNVPVKKKKKVQKVIPGTIMQKHK